MKTCLVCGAFCAPDASGCEQCGSADFGPISAAQPDGHSESADRSAVESAQTAPVSNEPAKRRR